MCPCLQNPQPRSRNPEAGTQKPEPRSRNPERRDLPAKAVTNLAGRLRQGSTSPAESPHLSRQSGAESPPQGSDGTSLGPREGPTERTSHGPAGTRTRRCCGGPCRGPDLHDFRSNRTVGLGLDDPRRPESLIVPHGQLHSATSHLDRPDANPNPAGDSSRHRSPPRHHRCRDPGIRRRPRGPMRQPSLRRGAIAERRRSKQAAGAWPVPEVTRSKVVARD